MRDIVNINPTGIIWRCADNLGDDGDVGPKGIQIDLAGVDAVVNDRSFRVDASKQS